MINRIFDGCDQLNSNFYRIKQRNLRHVIDDFFIYQISTSFNFDSYSSLYQNIEESEIAVINNFNIFDRISSTKYLIIVFKKSIVFIQQKLLHLLKQLFLNKQNLTIFYFSHIKSIISDISKIFPTNENINYQELKNELPFLEEINNFNKEIIILKDQNENNLNLSEMKIRLRSSITGYLIKQGYYTKKLKHNLSLNPEIIEDEDYIKLRNIGASSSCSVDLIYHFKKEALFALKSQYLLDNETSKLIQREILNYSRISHPFLPKLIGTNKKKR